jgi:predicted amidohydrolase YtcJ
MLASWAAAAVAGPVETVFVGGIVHPMDGAPDATAIAVRGGELAYVGDDAGAQRWIGPETRVVRLDGATVLPGMIDCHTHLAESGAARRDIQLADATTLDELGAAITAGIARDPHARWVRGTGWDVSLFDGHVDRAVLDALVGDRPAYFDDADGHTAWVSSAALARARITAATPDPAGGIIDRGANGEPTGLLRENAMSLVADRLPAYSHAQEDAGLDDALREANSFGITTIIDANVDEAILATYARRDRDGALTVRVRGAIEEDGPPSPKEIQRVLALKRRYDDDHLAVDAVKLYLDGVIETETAWMLAPYADDTNGVAQFTPADLKATMAAFDRLGLQIHVHAIGDAAIREGLDAIETLPTADGVRDRRPLFAHLEVIDPGDVPRFATLGVYADFQPLWAYPDSYIRDATWPFIGPERSEFLYPIAAVRGSGGTIVAGSDWSVSSMNPFEGMEVAVTRKDPDQPGDALTPAEAVPIDAIVAAYTRDAARAVFAEDRIGTITVGKRADLVVIDRDVLAIDPHDVSETRVLSTWLDGREVYHAE